MPFNHYAHLRRLYRNFPLMNRTEEDASREADRHEALDVKYLREATINYPEDAFCGWCGKLNDFADDCGFYYICGNPNDKKDNRVTCEECYQGTPGGIHVARYGVGDR